MSIRKVYHNLMASEEVHNKANSLTREQQMQFCNQYAVPRDDYSRSYIKYRCRCFMDFDNGNIKWYVLNSITALLFFPLWFIYTLNGFIAKRLCDKKGSVILKNSSFTNIDDILPEEKLIHYGEYEVVNACRLNRGVLSWKSQIILWTSIIKYPFLFYMNFLLLINLGKYEELIHSYQPKAIFSYADERTPINPLLTLLCENYDIDHIGFMHGEVYYQLDKGFFRYTEYLVWDEFYKDLFIDMKCNCPIHSYRPKKLQFEQIGVDNPPVFITYYDAENSSESLVRIAEIFNTLEKKGKKCIFRPHPRFSNTEVIKQVFKPSMIQNGRDVSLIQSLKQTKYAVAICSTVLMEAYYAGVSVMIDDVTDPERLERIADKGYIMLVKEHELLSSFTDER